ncbi:MAG TPA: GTPase HflX [Myxococcales bacterium LLY-WYZ-16_1]|nr:GTPase HflX [Myxococcales bacterium LLY-WYZ-16_1]
MRAIEGNTQGLKPRQLQRLQATYRRRVRGDGLVSVELARHLSDLSNELGRQVGVLVDRGGAVDRVVVGEPSRLYLPDIGRARGGAGRLRGLRLIRTELRDGGLTREDLADLSKLRLDAVAAVQTSGPSPKVHWAHLVVRGKDRTLVPDTETFDSVHQLPDDLMARVWAAETEIARVFGQAAQDWVRDTAVLVGVWAAGPKVRREAEASMAELRELARTAGVRVADEIIQIRRSVDPKTVLGKGKIEELTLRALELGAEVLIFDRDLSPSQLRAITNTTDLKVLDRTQLILDIFAQHARSKDGKLQVELAQLEYALPRLVERSTAMSRLTGGIGGQGPGETKLEIHRRRARARIHRLEQEIERLSRQRGLRRKRRHDGQIPVVGIVGYTNAGKSTLLNALTHADVTAENKLFATLDPTTRRIRFPEEREVVLTDTVGFIRDLPKELVNAFRATLEELSEADLILHVLDASDPRVNEKRESTQKILHELGLSDRPQLVVLNKVDQTPRPWVAALKKVTGGVPVSARDGTGLDELSRLVEGRIFDAMPLPTPERDGFYEEAVGYLRDLAS